MINAGAKMTQMENRSCWLVSRTATARLALTSCTLKPIPRTVMGEEYESKWFLSLQKMVGKEYLDPRFSADAPSRSRPVFATMQ